MADRDYVLGTDDGEIARLGLQHAVWRPRALDSWRRAGITGGQRVIDFGAGPGFASFDLADIVGPSGEVIALERSARFLGRLRASTKARGTRMVRPVEIDLATDAIPVESADAAWGRWIFAFLPDPRGALERLVGCLRPGGAVVIHEYFDYGAWRLAPGVASFEAFVAKVMESWRADGGEPDVGLDLPRWLEAAGCRILSLTPMVDVVDSSSFTWRWPAAFFDSNVGRLTELGWLSNEEARDMRADFATAQSDPATRMVTPLVLEIIARRR